MKQIKFEIFPQGVDIHIGNDVVSLYYNQLRKQKKSKKFKNIVLNNLMMPITHSVTFSNICKNHLEYSKNRDLVFSWIFS